MYGQSLDVAITHRLILELLLPEVIKVEEHQDGALTLTVEAVCDMVISNDAVITHELTVKFREDGSFQYLGNKV